MQLLQLNTHPDSKQQVRSACETHPTAEFCQRALPVGLQREPVSDPFRG
ncbi:MAG: hypothetical protein MUC60_08975 [Oscillatoria sp. Prado101]|nr:hypothetical protein [Oscillatoria sp. Prado101]